MGDVSRTFGNGHEELVAVPILTWANRASTGTIKCPIGYTWEDFVSIDWQQGIALNKTSFGSEIITREQLEKHPTDWVSEAAYTNSTSDATMRCIISATGSTTATWSGLTADVNYPICMIGWVKKYAAVEGTVVLGVADGAAITTNQRIEIDIASTLGLDWVDAELDVSIELFISGEVYSGWGEPNNEEIYVESVSTYHPRGAIAQKIGGKIVIMTAGWGITGTVIPYLAHADAQNVWKATTITSAKARVIVAQKSTRYIHIGSAAITETVLYDGPVVTDGQDVQLLDNMSKYDEIKVYGQFVSSGVKYVGSATFKPSDIVGSSFANYAQVHSYSDGNNSMVVRIDTAASKDTSLRSIGLSNLPTWTNVGIQKVVGRKFK